MTGTIDKALFINTLSHPNTRLVLAEKAPNHKYMSLSVAPYTSVADAGGGPLGVCFLGVAMMLASYCVRLLLL